MTVFKCARSAVCIAALFAGSAAQADVTAQQVWDSWKGYMGIYGENGFSVGSETMSGNTLTVSGMTIDSTTQTGTIKGTLDQILLTENGDGTVTVTMSDSYPITVTSTTPDGVNQVIDMAINQSGLKMMVSGTPEEMTYALTADRYGFKVNSIVEDGAPVPGDVTITANNVTGSYLAKTGDMRDITYDVKAATVDILADFADPQNGGAFTLSGQLKDMAANAAVIMPLDANMDMPETLFTNGMSIKGGYTYGAGNYLFSVKDVPDAMDGTASATGGTLDFSMDKDALAYNTATTGLTVNVTGAQIPFPIDVSLAELGMGFSMPLSKTDAPAPFTTKINLTDLAVNDMIWSMIDPTAALPHDPATAQIDLSGTAKLFYDLLDPAVAEELAAADVPGEIDSLNLNSLKLAVAGALITGTGGFTFDNTDMTTFDGIPAPTGEINLQINGANGLIDKLVAMGMVPEDQASMGRMMMGMFTQVVGDDQLTSKIEVKGDGSISANGQRIK